MSGTEPLNQRQVKASDADREIFASRLRDAHVAGQLTTDELDERLNVALGARTYGELEPLVRDLPPIAPASPQVMEPPPSTPPAHQRTRPTSGSTAMRRAWGIWFGAVAINLVIWLLVSITAGEAIYFWPIWVAGPWGAVLLSMSLYRRVSRG